MAGTWKANENIILKAAPMAWVFTAATTTPFALTKLWLFDNLGSATFKILNSSSSTSSGSYQEIKRADGVIYRFTKESLVLNGNDGSAVPSETGTDASSKGEITLVVNEADMDSDSWTEFIQSVQTNKQSKVLIVLPTGYSYERAGTGTSKKPDGYVYMFGKLTNDIEQQLTENATTLSLTFASQTNGSWAPTSDVSFSSFGIQVQRGGSSEDVTAVYPESIDVSTADLTSLQDGDILIKVTTVA